MRMIKNTLAVICLFVPSYASAYNWVAEVKVTSIEVTYMPKLIPFYVDQSIGSCPIGNPLKWTAQGDTADEKNQNAQAVLAVLLTAKLSGQKVMAYVIADGCRVEYLYLR